jgi:hypothetical protein
MDQASRNAGTENTEEDIELVSLIATRRPQRVYELPYEEQKGSWIGNHWLPPKGWRYFSAGELKTVYKDKRIMWVGGSLARRAALTMYGVLNETTAYSSDMNVPAAAIDGSGVLDVNKRKKTEFVQNGSMGIGTNQKVGVAPCLVRWRLRIRCQKKFSALKSFLVDELSGKSNITEKFDTIIIAIGNWDSVSPKEERSNILSDMTASIDALGKLQSIGKTIFRGLAGSDTTTGKRTSISSKSTRMQWIKLSLSQQECSKRRRSLAT